MVIKTTVKTLNKKRTAVPKCGRRLRKDIKVNLRRSNSKNYRLKLPNKLNK